MLKVLELFAGIGACSKALERLGIDHEIIDAVEIDKYAIKSFNAIHGTNFETQDITKWDKDVEIDLIMHGSPCQDFSLAGKQAGGDEGSGTRSSLMYETIRIVENLKPKYVIWENVKNLLSKKHRHNFDAYLETMEELGYTNYYQVLNAKDYGIPQNRERVFTVSIRKDIDKGYEFPEKQELKLRLKDMLEEYVDEKYYLSDEKIDKIAHWKAYQKPFEKVQGKNSIVPTITARGAGEEHSGMITVSEKLEETTNLQEQCRNLKEILCNELVNQNIVKDGFVVNHSYTNGLCGKNPNSRQTLEDYIESKNGIMPTMTTRPDTLGIAIDKPPLRIRKLTPKECWRLMGFNDYDFEKVEHINSNSQLYKQAGNSIVVNVLEKILENLLGGNK